MKFNIVLLIIAMLLVVDAGEQDSMKRELMNTNRELRKATTRSSYKAPSYTKKTYTKTYKKTYTASRTSYTGAFYGGRSYAVLYVYYLPPAGYYQVGGYYSYLYNK